MKLKFIYVMFLILFSSCKEKGVIVEAESFLVKHYIETRIKEPNFSIEIKISNNSKNEFEINHNGKVLNSNVDLSKLRLSYKKELYNLGVPIDFKGAKIKYNESLLLEMKLNIVEILGENLTQIDSNYSDFIHSKNEIKNQFEKTIPYSKSYEIKYFLDEEEVSKNDSVRMNYLLEKDTIQFIYPKELPIDEISNWKSKY